MSNVIEEKVDDPLITAKEVDDPLPSTSGLFLRDQINLYNI